MNLLSWNCRGLGNPRTVRDLHQMVKERRPNFVFLMETMCSKQYMDRIKLRLGFDNLFVVDPVGRSGGLALLWYKEDNLEIFNYSRRHINVVVKDMGGQPIWKMTGFYGHSDSSKRDESWAILRHLKLCGPIPWLCAGDFNEIVDQSEKEGFAVRREAQMVKFRETLEECQLGDLGFVGPFFTWSNRRMDDTFTRERLDRAVANMEWCSIFPIVSVLILAARTSDHNPIVVKFQDSPPERCSVRRGFKFEACWMKDKESFEVIKEAWCNRAEGGVSIRSIQNRLAGCQEALSRWSCGKFGNVEDLIKRKSEQLLALQQSVLPSRGDQIKLLQNELDDLLECEEMKWKQRAKQYWFSQGDRNTAFFHSWANHRRKINSIRWIYDEQGQVWRKYKDISRVIVGYFKSLYSSQGSIRGEECLQSVLPKVTQEMNAWLLHPFLDDEVRAALFQMHPLKSPGPDGFPAIFYQKNWDVVGKDVCCAVLSFLNGGQFDPSLNATNIVLIPKVSSPSQITDFRPISLCNVLYKIISKVLANRLKSILPHIISPEQSAFVPGRLITDNVLVGFETLHTMASRLSGKEGFMALKLDMSKAYDRIEWDFLEAMLRKLGFADQWINLIMSCVRTVSFSILINGRPNGQFNPSRGLRQGDPLSPYLFILCAEALCSSINKAVMDGDLHGIPISRKGIRINQLYFADDCLLFCKANMGEWRRFQGVLSTYEAASGQKINREKTALFFIRNTKQEVREAISQEIGAGCSKQFERYLGLPTLIGRSRVSSFNHIKGRIWCKLNGWKEKLLTHAGKEILLKSVIQANPTYTISVFRLPKTLSKEINSLMSKFWWSFKDNFNRISWCSWKKLGQKKEAGGMGFRELDCFNMALLAKQGWRLLKFPDSLAARVLKEKYFPKSSFLMSSLGKRPSFAWRSIWNAKPLIEEGIMWRVGNGLNVKIWEDKWIPSSVSHKIQDPIRVLSRDAKVAEIINVEQNWWNISLIEHIFSADTVERICSIPICPRSQEDQLIWAGTKSGIFCVRSAYHLEADRRSREQGGPSNALSSSSLWKRIWSLKIPRVVIVFIWRACNEILPTRGNLFKRKIVPDPLCPMCGLEPETSGHILWWCESARAVWSLSGGYLQKSVVISDSFLNIFEYLSNRLSTEMLELFVVIAYKLWLRRNRVVFDDLVMHPSCLLKGAIEMLEDFRLSQKTESSIAIDRLATSSQWVKPSGGTVKINWDAALCPSKKIMGVGVVARDATGAVKAALCSSLPYVSDPSVAESLGARQAIVLGQKMGFPSIVLEGDAKEIVLGLRNPAGCSARLCTM
jgi:hypothetical protein